MKNDIKEWNIITPRFEVNLRYVKNHLLFFTIESYNTCADNVYTYIHLCIIYIQGNRGRAPRAAPVVNSSIINSFIKQLLVHSADHIRNDV